MADWLVSMHAVVRLGAAGSMTDSFNVEVSAPDAKGALGQAAILFDASLEDGEQLLSAAPWVWELDETGHKIDSGQSVSLEAQ